MPSKFALQHSNWLLQIPHPVDNQTCKGSPYMS